MRRDEAFERLDSDDNDKLVKGHSPETSQSQSVPKQRRDYKSEEQEEALECEILTEKEEVKSNVSQKDIVKAHRLEITWTERKRNRRREPWKI